jgi:hypothetical protein
MAQRQFNNYPDKIHYHSAVMNVNLPLLLDSISKLNYPKERFEVILVDDESEEVFSPHCSLFSIRIIKKIIEFQFPKKMQSPRRFPCLQRMDHHH